MAKTIKAFEQKMKPNGKMNPKYVDLLNEDPSIASQLYGCYSFISPEKVIKQRELFLFEKFVKQWGYTKALSMYSEFTQFLAFKYHLNADTIMNDLVEFVQEEENVLKREDTEGDYKQFLDKHESRLTEEFQKNNKFQTSRKEDRTAFCDTYINT
jgi:hypothetical protein